MRPFKHAAIFVVLSFTVLAQQEAMREAQVEPKAKPAMREAQVEPKAKPAMREAQVEPKAKPAMREAQTVQFKAPDMQTVKKILEEQKKAFGCNLTDQEMKTAAENYMKENPVVFDSPNDPTRHGRVLMSALQKLGGNMENADKVFEEMELEKKGISKREWDRHTKNIKPEQKAQLEAQLAISAAKWPKNQAELDKNQLEWHIRRKNTIENGLLTIKILKDYNLNHKGNQIDEKLLGDWGIEAYQKKQKAISDWWSDKLKPQYPEEESRKMLCGLMLKDCMFSLSVLIGGGADWRIYFHEKLKK